MLAEFAPAVVVSRQVGSGGRRICEGLAACLHFQLWDREILDRVASRGHLTARFDLILNTAALSVENCVSITLKAYMELFDLRSSAETSMSTASRRQGRRQARGEEAAFA